MVTRVDTPGGFRFAAVALMMLGTVAVGGIAQAQTPDLSVTLSPQEGNGLLKYAGGSSVLDGENIGVESITGLGTPLHGPSTTLPVVNGSIDFNTGAFSGGNAAGTEWDFGPGGFVTLRGAVPSLGIGTNTVLMTGTFSDPSFVKSLNGQGLKVQGGAFLSVVDPTLASYFGLPTGGVLYSGGLSTLFRADGTSPSSFVSDGFTGGTLTVAPVADRARGWSSVR